MKKLGIFVLAVTGAVVTFEVLRRKGIIDKISDKIDECLYEGDDLELTCDACDITSDETSETPHTDVEH